MSRIRLVQLVLVVVATLGDPLPAGRVQARVASNDLRYEEPTLPWLRAAQADDGSWGASSDASGSDPRVGVTALVELSLLGSGLTPWQGRRSSRELVAGGLDFLMAAQDEVTGRIGAPDADPLEHVLATCALCELHAASDDVSGSRLVADAALAALAALGEIVALDDASRTSRASPHLDAWIVWTLARARTHGLTVAADVERRALGALEAIVDAACAGELAADDERLVPAMAALVLHDDGWAASERGRAALALLPEDFDDVCTISPGARPDLERILFVTVLLFRVRGALRPTWGAWESRLFESGGLRDIVGLRDAPPRVDQQTVRAPFGTPDDALALAALTLTISYRYDWIEDA